MSGNQIHVFWEAAGNKGTDGPNRVGAHKDPTLQKWNLPIILVLSLLGTGH